MVMNDIVMSDYKPKIARVQWKRITEPRFDGPRWAYLPAEKHVKICDSEEIRPSGGSDAGSPRANDRSKEDVGPLKTLIREFMGGFANVGEFG
jgi:hypothetical protein